MLMQTFGDIQKCFMNNFIQTKRKWSYCTYIERNLPSCHHKNRNNSKLTINVVLKDKKLDSKHTSSRRAGTRAFSSFSCQSFHQIRHSRQEIHHSSIWTLHIKDRDYLWLCSSSKFCSNHLKSHAARTHHFTSVTTARTPGNSDVVTRPLSPSSTY